MSLGVECIILGAVLALAVWGLVDNHKRCECIESDEGTLLHTVIDIDSEATQLEIYLDAEGYMSVKQYSRSMDKQLKYVLKDDVYDMRFNVCPKCGRLTDREDLDYEDD